ncbi:metallophosphoesterase [Candidatus Woesearchaeota archaeon]|nr:metallophosphoesterase [Candidatus Woesearchaeota archaeon]
MKPYSIDETLVLFENAVFLPKEKTIVVADLQLGYEQQLRALGHNIVYEQAKKMLKQLEKLLILTEAERLVLNGDLKHEFGRISSQEKRDIKMILRRLKKRVEIVVVKGNHDTLTKPLTDELGIELLDSWSSGDFLCVHGHKLPEELQKTIIIGHLHPAVLLSDGVRREKYKCFLVGNYKRKRLLVLPSFSTITDGANILKTGSNSPLLNDRSLKNCEVFVIADEIRPFGTVKDLHKLVQ